MQRADNQPTRLPSPATRHPRRVAVLIVVAAAVTATTVGFAYDRYAASRLAGSVRNAFAARRYDEARGLVPRWIRQRPRSAEAQYYRAWLALVDQQPSEAFGAIQQAARLGYDPALLGPL